MSDEDSIRGQGLTATPTLRELAMVLFRRRQLFLWVSGLVLAAAILFALVGTKYEANMKVLVRRGRANAPVTAGENAPLDLTRVLVTEEELNSEVELLRDDDVLRTVVKETGLGGRDWFHFLRMGEGNAERVERAAQRLASRLAVEPVKKTNLIVISYSADDPQIAAKVLQSVEKAYLEKHMEVHRPSGEYRFFEQQAVESRRQLEEAQRKLLDFSATRGVVAAAEQRDLALQKLSEVDASYRQTRVDLVETQERAWALETQLEKLPERTTTQVRTADNAEAEGVEVESAGSATKADGIADKVRAEPSSGTGSRAADYAGRGDDRCRKCIAPEGRNDRQEYAIRMGEVRIAKDPSATEGTAGPGLCNPCAAARVSGDRAATGRGRDHAG